MTSPNNADNSSSFGSGGRPPAAWTGDITPGGDVDTFSDINDELFGGGTEQWDTKGRPLNPWSK